MKNIRAKCRCETPNVETYRRLNVRTVMSVHRSEANINVAGDGGKEGSKLQ